MTEGAVCSGPCGPPAPSPALFGSAQLVLGPQSTPHAADSTSLRQRLLIRTQRQADQAALASQPSVDSWLSRGDSLPVGSPLPESELHQRLDRADGDAAPRRRSASSSAESRSPASPSAMVLERWGNSPRAVTSLHYASQLPPSAPPPTPATPGTPASLCTPKAGPSRAGSVIGPRSWTNSAAHSQHSSAAPSRAASGNISTCASPCAAHSGC